jgi:hypothetical protein
MKIGDWELHPACVNMPPLEPAEFAKLRDSIRELGQLEPIVRWGSDGSVLDGRHRLAACVELGVEPRFEERDILDPWAWVWAVNVDRRHLEPGRRVALRLLYDEAMQRMLAAAEAAAAERKRATQFKAKVALSSPYGALPEATLEALARHIDRANGDRHVLPLHGAVAEAGADVPGLEVERKGTGWDIIAVVDEHGYGFAGPGLSQATLRRIAKRVAARPEIPPAAAAEPPPAAPEWQAPDIEVPFPRDAAEEETVRATLPAPEPVRPRVLLARATAVGERTAEKALRVREKSRELLEQVAKGQVSLHQAERQARRASNSEWAEYEAYCTPLWPVELLASSGYLGQPVLAVEPCVGSGAIVRGLGDLVKLWITGDIREVEPVPHALFHFHHSWLDGEPREKLARAELRRLAKAELVITNPPFSRAQEVVEAAWTLCPWADIWVLQRRSWHDQARDAWFARHQPDELNLSPRVRFEWPDGSLVGDGTDNTIYTWYGFSAAKKQPCRGPHGGISRTLLRADRAA